MLSTRIILGIIFYLHLMQNPLGANGSMQSSSNFMDPWITTKENWWLFVTNRKYGIYYHGQTFVPLAKMAIVQTVLALAASQSWHLLEMDIEKKAFMHRDLKEEVYMQLSPG